MWNGVQNRTIHAWIPLHVMHGSGTLFTPTIGERRQRRRSHHIFTYCDQGSKTVEGSMGRSPPPRRKRPVLKDVLVVVEGRNDMRAVRAALEVDVCTCVLG